MKQFVAGAAFGLASALVLFPVAKAAISPDAAAALDRFARAITEVHNRYQREVGYAELVDDAIAGMVSRLDPHSSYMTAAAFKSLAETPTKNAEHAGVGIIFDSPAGVAHVTSTIENSPAAAAGIRANDVIAAVDGRPVEGLSIIEIVDLLKGDAGSKLTLTLVRGTSSFDVTMTRKVIVMPEGRLTTYGDVGYVRLFTFNQGTRAFLHDSIASLRQKLDGHLKGYVLDLRGNAGGLLDAGVAVADTFLDSGVIVTLNGRDHVGDQTYPAGPGDDSDGKPIVVLIDRNSAEDAEIVAAALQDAHRATILGERSAGQARVQTIIPLGENGGALRLTTATFSSPAGHVIDNIGVVPDVTVPAGGYPSGKADPQLAAALVRLEESAGK
jgi:carboxyl-terminal processing protease